MEKPSSPKKSGGPSSPHATPTVGVPTPTPAASTGFTPLVFGREPVPTAPTPARSGLSLELSAPRPVHGPPLLAQPAIPQPQQWLSQPTHRPLRGYLHMTSPENLQGIHDAGLIANKNKGFGTPKDGGIRDKEGVYVVDEPRWYKGDVASGHVGVVSTREPIHDLNYPHNEAYTEHGAGYFMHRAAPLRDAITEGHGPSEPYSFTLPMTPRTAQGAQRLMKATAGRDLGPAEAAGAVGGAVTSRFPAYFTEPFHPAGGAPRHLPPISSFESSSLRELPSSLAPPSRFPVLPTTSARRIGHASSPAAPPAENVTLHGAWPPILREDHFKP